LRDGQRGLRRIPRVGVCSTAGNNDLRFGEYLNLPVAEGDRFGTIGRALQVERCARVHVAALAQGHSSDGVSVHGWLQRVDLLERTPVPYTPRDRRTGGRSPSTPELAPIWRLQGAASDNPCVALGKGKWTAEEWAEEGKRAILDLLSDRIVAPWAEVEARIAAGWKQFRTVQPLQLGGARRELLADDLIVEERTAHKQPVVTLRLPEVAGTRRTVARLRGEKRKLYRAYLKWTGDPASCGHHAEAVFLDSMKAASGENGMSIPPQRTGHVPRVRGKPVRPGPLDVLAYIPEFPDALTTTPMVVEVKNVHDWIYPPDRRLWELLVKSAGLVRDGVHVFPVLGCVRSAWQTGQMARDVGFLACDMGQQVFTPNPTKVDPEQFDVVRTEFGLPILQTDGPLDSVIEFMTRVPRREEYDREEGRRVPWYELQTRRFAQLAESVLDFDALTGDLPPDARTRSLIAFEERIKSVATWPLIGGWAGAR
jgi:hypothetical protein